MLSLISSIISHAPAGRTVLLAFLFAILFAALGFGIAVLFEKFLDVESSSGDVSETAEAPKKGQTVDIVIQDEDLPSDESANQYFVGSNHQMLTAADMEQGAAAKNYSAADAVRAANQGAVSTGIEDLNEAKEFAPGETSAEQKFVPVRNLETLYNVSGKEAVKKDTQAPVTADIQAEERKPAVPREEATFTAEDEDLDTLPSFDGFDGVGRSGSSASDEEGINTESDFASNGVRTNKVEEPEVKDAALMAKAISSILSSE